MCDTVVALANSTRDGCVLFGKNSDREFNEAHIVVTLPSAEYAEGSILHCTYIDIPQVQHTHAVLLAKPYWIWGAEMGANEWGVAIGNEAVFSKVPAGKKPGLIGMDFLRLALERAKTAEEALHVIVGLLETYGQSGNCSLTHGLFYHNSYLIADRKTAWVLETVDREWAALEVKNVYAISNGLTIGNHWDLSSENLVNRAVDKKWCKSRNDFDFAKCYSDLLFTKFSQARQRSTCALNSLQSSAGKITESSLMAVLRSHGESTNSYRPDKSIMDWTLCMHQGWGPFRQSQSVGSMVSRLGGGDDTHWVTATSAPCTSFYKPVWVDSGIPGTGIEPDNTFNQESLWWRHEQLHRTILKDYSNRIGKFQKQRDLVESKWLTEEKLFRSTPEQKRRDFSEKIFNQADGYTHDWIREVKKTPVVNKNAFYYELMLKEENKRSGYVE